MVQLSRLQTYKNPPRLMNRSMCLRRFHFLFAVNDNVVDCETLAGCSGYPRRVGARRSASIPPAASVLATTAHPGEPGKDRSQSKHANQLRPRLGSATNGNDGTVAQSAESSKNFLTSSLLAFVSGGVGKPESGCIIARFSAKAGLQR